MVTAAGSPDRPALHPKHVNRLILVRTMGPRTGP
jgi:hypothetical protein